MRSFLITSIAALCASLLYIGYAQQAKPPKDKISILRDQAANATSDTARAHALCALCEELFRSNMDTALVLGINGLMTAEKAKEPRTLGFCQNKVGAAYNARGEHAKALGYFLKSLRNYELVGEGKGLGDALYNMAAAYFYMDDYTQALDHFLKSLKFRQQLQDQTGIAACLMNIGNVYYKQNELKRAEEYTLMGLKLFEQMQDKKGLSKAYNNLGTIYMEIGDNLQAAENFRKSMEIKQEIGDKNGVGITLLNLGTLSSKQQAYQVALESYQSALSIFMEQKNKVQLSKAYNNLATTHLKLRDIPQSLVYSESALAAALETGAKDDIMKAYQLRSEIDSTMGNFQLAYQHYKLYSAYNDSLFNEEKIKEVGKIEGRYEMQKQIDDQQEEEAALAAAEEEATERRNNLQFLAIFGFFALLAVVLFSLGKFRVPVKVANGLIFMSLLLFFEFALILFDPINDQYSGGTPVLKLLFNMILALIVTPAHAWLEQRIKRRIPAVDKG